MADSESCGHTDMRSRSRSVGPSRITKSRSTRCATTRFVCAWEALGRSPHVVSGTQSENLAGMAAKGRGGGKAQPWRWRELNRAGRVSRSLRAREALRNGWDEEALRQALWQTQDPTLF